MQSVGWEPLHFAPSLGTISATLGDHNDAHLLEVLIQGRGDVDVQIVHYDLARAVRETPAARVPRSEQNPRTADLVGLEEVKGCQRLVEENAPGFQSQHRALARD